MVIEKQLQLRLRSKKYPGLGGKPNKQIRAEGTRDTACTSYVENLKVSSGNKEFYAFEFYIIIQNRGYFESLGVYPELFFCCNVEK